MINKKELVTISVVVFILVSGVYTLRNAGASEDKYAWMSDSAIKIEQKEMENTEYRRQKEELNKLINANKVIITNEQCKIESRNEMAVCWEKVQSAF